MIFTYNCIKYILYYKYQFSILILQPFLSYSVFLFGHSTEAKIHTPPYVPETAVRHFSENVINKISH